jgi:hypothetical protein
LSGLLRIPVGGIIGRRGALAGSSTSADGAGSLLRRRRPALTCPVIFFGVSITLYTGLGNSRTGQILRIFDRLHWVMRRFFLRRAMARLAAAPLHRRPKADGAPLPTALVCSQQLIDCLIACGALQHEKHLHRRAGESE